MGKTLTFGQKIALGYLVVASIALLIGGLSVYALRTIVAEKDRVIAVYAQNLVDAAKLESDSNRRIADNRGYLLSKDSDFLQDLRSTRKPFDLLTGSMQGHVTTPEEKQAPRAHRGRLDGANRNRRPRDGAPTNRAEPRGRRPAVPE